MARFCGICVRSFPTQRGLSQHHGHYHRRPKPQAPQSMFRRHPHLRGDPCDVNGNALPAHFAPPPPPPPAPEDWSPFPDRTTFEYAEHTFEQMESSEGYAGALLRILAAREAQLGLDNIRPIFDNVAHQMATIDAIPHGDQDWTSFALRYAGPVQANSSGWKHKTYVFHRRDALKAVENIVASPDFKNSFDVAPYEEFLTLPTGEKTRRFSNLMSGQWAYKKAQIAEQSSIQDEIATNSDHDGDMLVPIICGADKTTVSVQTGNQEFHPVYLSVGNVHNDMRRAHREAVVPLAFLAIPKGDRADEDSEEFRIFKKQLYHHALTMILSPLRPGMLAPHVMKCPDGLHCRAIFQLGPFIADYPEQVYLAGIVQGWCPKCLARPEQLATAGDPRFRDLNEELRSTFNAADLWDSFDVVNDVTPFTDYFPRADIQELLTPDLLHQLIKGTFKDHLVTWVEDYIRATAPSAAEAKRVLDDIDRRLAATPSFPGLRHFPNGRNFSQWTGNDSKALMTIFLPAIVGYVPDKMVQCITALIDFSYLACRSAHTTEDLADMDATLHRFHQLCTIFKEAGVRPDGFSLPRQHALVHYVRAIQLFGSPNGLCSSITESKHITAVKRPWRRSSRREPLGQMLYTLTRLSKLAAIRADFAKRRMLRSDVYQHTRCSASLYAPPDKEVLTEERFMHEADAMVAEEPYSSMSSVALSSRAAYTHKLHNVVNDLNEPQLPEYLRQFFHDRLYSEYKLAVNLPLDACPALPLDTHMAVYQSAQAIFYAPSEAAGRTGMHQEFIRCSPNWYECPHYDTVLVHTNPDAVGMLGMNVARVRAFFSFTYDYTRYECTFVEWFELDGEVPDAVTGMWIVKPEKSGGHRIRSVISISTIVRACLLSPVYGRSQVPIGFQYTESLSAFRRYYVNWYADYHAHEMIV
ncbi:hypothetical protein BD309DRAFT_995400 [Dichomitus squalens]|nr:hypothetical protein BD309DRAFT_995400 [Dichomitus squalens]